MSVQLFPESSGLQSPLTGVSLQEASSCKQQQNTSGSFCGQYKFNNECGEVTEAFLSCTGSCSVWFRVADSDKVGRSNKVTQPQTCLSAERDMGNLEG